METVTIVDTSICTDNLGDEIIMEAVDDVVTRLFPEAYIYRAPSHEALSDRTLKFIRGSSWCFIGGTNLLSSHITPHGLWRLDERGAAAYGSTRTVCLGTGWSDYSPDATAKTRGLLRTALSPHLVHSVRSNYALDHLRKLGRDAVTTSCVTTWSLTPDHCAQLASKTSQSAVFTLTAWRREPDADRAFVEVLRTRYKKLHFWPQMHDDYDYFRKFGWESVSMIAPTLQAFDRFLENEDVDFVGTRLHGGIRALQKRRRALILAVDNRAAEIAKHSGLPVVQRADTAGIERWIDREAPIRFDLPQEAIESWLSQFKPPQRNSVPQPEPLPDRGPAIMSVQRIKNVARAALGR